MALSFQPSSRGLERGGSRTGGAAELADVDVEEVAEVEVSIGELARDRGRLGSIEVENVAGGEVRIEDGSSEIALATLAR